MVSKKSQKRILAFILAVVLVSTILPISAIAAPNLDNASAWARDGITEAVEKGFVPTDLQSNYTSVITRQEFCRMAVKWLEYATGQSIDAMLFERGLSRTPNAFTDTNDPDILAAFALSITSGVGNNRFDPNGQFNREQAATMIMRTVRVLGIDVSNPPVSDFVDLDMASEWAHQGINYVRANGIMQGVGDNRFAPLALYTREQSIITFNNIEINPLIDLVFSITNILVESNNSVLLEITSSGGCFVNVNILSDVTGISTDWTSGDLLSTGRSHIPFETTKSFVNVPISGRLPDYFVVLAFIRGSDGEMLSEPYTFIQYTRAYEEFLAQTIYDFDEKSVINLDEYIDNNFIVLSEGVSQLTTSSLDASRAEEGVYIFNSIVLFGVGERIAVICEITDQIYFIEVLSITNNGSVTTVVANSDSKLEDFADVVKIDLEFDLEDGIYDSSSADEGVVWLDNPDAPEYNVVFPVEHSGHTALLGVLSTDTGIPHTRSMYGISTMSRTLSTDVINIGGTAKSSISIGIRYTRGAFSVTGKVTGEVKASVRVVYDIVLFGPNFCEIKVAAGVELVAKVELKFGIERTTDLDSINLGGISFPSPIPGVYLRAGLTLPIQFQASGGVVAEVKVSAETGVKFGTNGFQRINKRTATADIYAEGEASIKFGPKFTITIKVVGDIVKASLFVEGGLEVKAKATTATTYHLCTLCVSMIVDCYVKLGFECSASIFGIKSLTWKYEHVFAEWRIHLFDYYISIISDNPGRGRGKCPNDGSASDDKREELLGLWIGTYNNNFGLNGVELSFFRDGDDIKAIFSFFPVAESPSSQRSGSYFADVSYNESTGQFNLRGTSWIDRPSGWIFVSFSGTIEGNTFSGLVDNNSNRPFSVSRRTG
jgi:hypothetical protein